MRKYNLFNFLEKKMSAEEICVAMSKLGDQIAFKELALHIAISYIANALSKCEIKTYENGKEIQGQLYYLLNVSPNPNQNASQFMNQLIENYFYDNEALVIMHKDHLYCADSFDIVDDNPLAEYTYENVSFGGTQLKKRFKANEVFHFRLDNKDVKSLVDSLYSQYGEIMDLALQSFKTTNRRKYKLILEQYKAGDPQFNEVFENVIKQQLSTFVENNNAVYPKFKGMDLEEFQSTARGDTSDIISMRKETFEMVAQAFKIPQTMMLGNIVNMNEIVKVFLTFAVEPPADMISEEFTRKKYSFDEWKKGNYIEVDTSCINYVDIFADADKAEKAISSGLATIDELRPRVRLPKLDTDFSTSHFMTKNFDLAENILNSLQGKGVNENETDVLFAGTE